uniref:Uncharacterized protein n=1 Tax=Mesocestoides corti TaxID=53468 RepID=A0A5K3FKH3_MESCO
MAQTYWTTWPQPVICPFFFHWHVKKICSQLETDTLEKGCIMGSIASVVNLDGLRLT